MVPSKTEVISVVKGVASGPSTHKKEAAMQASSPSPIEQEIQLIAEHMNEELD